MQGEERQNFGEAEAQQIKNSGWRQGSIFRPPENFVPVRFERDREVLVVCTQSCTVVSPNIAANPLIEYLVAKPVERYHPNSDQAKGKNSHCFHLPVSGLPNAEALGCDINRRFFADRKECITHAPDNRITPSEEGVRNLAGWIARYYTRIALPDELVTRAKKGLFEIIQKALRTRNLSGEKMSDAVDKIYIAWSPNSDLQGSKYQVGIQFLCRDADAAFELGSSLIGPLEPFTENNGNDGIKLVYDAVDKTNTLISALDGYKRLTEWDYLSNLGDVAESES